MTEPIHETGNLSGSFPEPKEFQHAYAGFWIRFWSYLIDLIVLGSLSMLAVRPMFRLAGLEIAPGAWYAPYNLLTAAIFFLYFILMTKYFGQTVGKMVTGIRVIRRDGGRLDWKTVLFREWVGRYFSKTLMVLYLVVGFTPKKEALHDYIADTLVIHEERYQKAALSHGYANRLQDGHAL
ncbi:RDD family protein [Bhargavaea massiliensis]|uniref:RDD family protein n=1 Tax=Bhargavaea massiliensis TaxID=2697500 RepID=UPI001BCD03BE|nr:RDD family protein [Bhargavaea massiliensis]